MFKSGQSIANKVFSLDNKVMRAFGISFDLVLLNLLFIVGCLPIVTMGVSITAMYSVTLKMVKKENGSVAKDFLKAYKENMKQGIFFGLIGCAVALLLYVDAFYLQFLFPTHEVMIKVVVIAVSFVAYFIYLYIFPLLARYVYTSKQVYQTALKMSLSNLPWNIVFISLNIPVIAMFLYSGTTMLIMCLFMIVGGFAGMAYMQSILFRKIFAKYE